MNCVSNIELLHFFLYPEIKGDISRRMETHKYWSSQTQMDQDLPGVTDAHGSHCFICNRYGGK